MVESSLFSINYSLLIKIVMAKRDYYEVLEVTKSASEEEIKKAYRKMEIGRASCRERV